MNQYTINLCKSYPVWKIGNKINPISNECLDYMLFIASPLLIGQATTVGVAMRRTLLESIEGIAITAAQINGVIHEYSILEGVEESIHDILLNLKHVVIKSDIHDEYPLKKCIIHVKGPRKITAKDIQTPDNIIICNPNYHIATITKPISLHMQLVINKGKGFVIHNENSLEKGYFPVDAIFNPIQNVNFSVHTLENKQEALILEIWTDKSISAIDALKKASENLVHLFLPPFALTEYKYTDNTIPSNEDTNLFFQENLEFNSINSLPQKNTFDKFTSNEYSQIPIELLELSTRPFKCLKNANIDTIQDLLQVSQQDLLKIPNMGPSSVKQILETLDKRFGIHLE
jgi:DNA-directed RNA polymerase subunit alpha